MVQGRLTEADTPTIWHKGKNSKQTLMHLCIDLQEATPSGLTSAHLHHPPIFFTGRMPFLPSNQQRENTEGKQ